MISTIKKQELKCKYCDLQIDMLKTSNHIIGCNLEAVAQVLRYRGCEKEAEQLDNIASRIK